MKNVCAQELAPPFSLLWPQNHKPLHRLWDLYPGFGGQGPARGLLDATTYRCNNALVSLCSDLHGFPGKIKPEQAQLLLPRPHIVITRLCVLAGTSAASGHHHPQDKQCGPRPVTAQRKPRSCLLHPIIPHSILGRDAFLPGNRSLVPMPALALQWDRDGQGKCWAWPGCCFSVPITGFLEDLPAESLFFFPILFSNVLDAGKINQGQGLNIYLSKSQSKRDFPSQTPPLRGDPRRAVRPSKGPRTPRAGDRKSVV